MKLTIELDREVDGRWIAEVPELNVLLVRGLEGWTRFKGLSRRRGRSSATGSLTANCLPIPRMPHSTPHEILAFGEGAWRRWSVHGEPYRFTLQRPPNGSQVL